MHHRTAPPQIINNKLQQPEAASGVLDYAMKHFGELEIQATWYEKLHEWEDALLAYGKKLELAKEEPDLILGRMRCLEALGEWGQLHQQCCEEWTLVSEETQAKMARMAAAAAWGLGHWDSMEEYTCMIPRDTHDGAFYRAVLALHQDLFSLAQQCIDINTLLPVLVCSAVEVLWHARAPKTCSPSEPQPSVLSQRLNPLPPFPQSPPFLRENHHHPSLSQPPGSLSSTISVSRDSFEIFSPLQALPRILLYLDERCRRAQVSRPAHSHTVIRAQVPDHFLCSHWLSVSGVTTLTSRHVPPAGAG
ncbi:hypothetical protein CRUP_032804 [Coryphaenoides rupestris]|nr:hypothetical protein CRUP_032804 [Coryphaenoides rupestris]